jgi:hypothetical protein
MCTCLGWLGMIGYEFVVLFWLWCGLSETGWRIVLYVAFRMELKDWCILKETKQTSVNNEPISFSLGVSGIQILCELNAALFLIMETW